MMLKRFATMLPLMFVTALTLAGCGHQTVAPTETATDGEHTEGDGHKHEEAGHDHSGWWCNEHGVPEGVCAQCDSKVAADFQKKGDWCKEHDRPDSQCFKCHPELEAKFAAQYHAKYGKNPPAPEG